MSYVDNLYNCISTIQKNSGKSRRAIEDLLRFFRYRVEIEEEHMKGLEKLSNFNMMLRDGTILNAVNALKKDSYVRAFQVKTLIDSINADIISQLTMLLKTQSEDIIPYYSKAVKVQRTKEDFIEKIAKNKKKY